MVVTTDVQVAFVVAAVFTDLGRRYILAEHQKSYPVILRRCIDE